MATAPGKCPLCGKNTAEKTKPFCSARCATLDLGRWLGEGYRIPVNEDDLEESTSLSPGNEDE